MNNENMHNLNDEIDLKKLFLVFWNRKLLISSFTTLAAIISVLYSLSLPNIYTSNALLAPTSSNDSLTSKLGNYSSLAGLAGISLPGETGDKTAEAIARMKSYDFFVDEFLPNIKLQDLMASKKWVIQTNTVIYNEKIFDEAKNEWVRKVKYPRMPKPSNQEAYKIYNEILFISQDPKTSFVKMSIDHKSPYIAEKWLKLIIQNINNYMRDLDKILAANSVKFLNNTAQSTNFAQIKVVIAKLLEDQMQDLMLAEATKDYAFMPIASPIAPERKSKPSRAVICILGTMAGFVLSLITALFLHSFNFRKI